MASLGAEVVAVDIAKPAKAALTEAAQLAGLSGRLEAIAADLTAIPLPAGPFDIVVGKAFLHHLTHGEEDALLARVAAVLRPDGEARFVEPCVNNRLLDMLR